MKQIFSKKRIKKVLQFIVYKETSFEMCTAIPPKKKLNTTNDA